MTPTTILVPIDYSDPSIHALDYACSLASKLGATIHVVHAIGIPMLGIPEAGMAWATVNMAETVAVGQARLDELIEGRKVLATFGPALVVSGDPRDEILHAAERVHADLIIMGTHGRRGLARALLGSVAEAIVRSAPCAVLTVRDKRRAKHEAKAS
jgi:nucleotide-binding universal stress UspA family protein